MGLFDKVLSGQTSENVTLTEQEAFFAILQITVGIDGDVSDDEIDAVVSATGRMRLFQGQTGEDFGRMAKKTNSIQEKHGLKFLLPKAVEVLSPDLRQTAFAMAADLIFADGSVEENEKALIEILQRELEVPDDLALKIVEVLQIKNRG